MPGLDTSACLDLSVIKNGNWPGERCSAPEAAVDSVLINVELPSLALRHGTSRLGGLFLRPARLPRPRSSIPRGLAGAGRQKPLGQRTCA
ncbi:MAG: hypothetical protein OXH76_00880 [Boseongicola sp.]|nr:hypothetical protein [Boseongicola sp.]